MASDKKVKEMIDYFSILSDWEDKYEYIIELGKKLNDFPDELKVDNNLVSGCMSKVWLVRRRFEDGSYEVLADSDAVIVRGFLYLLKALFDGKTEEEIKETDADGFFSELGVFSSISQQRKNGLLAVTEEIKTFD